MNWKKIKEQYPAAWSAFCKWGGFRWLDEPEWEHEFDRTYVELPANELLGIGNVKKPWTARACYDFFDERGIYVTIGFEVFEKNLFTWLIENEEETILASGQESPFGNRIEAEAAAFERAFSILNNQNKQ